MRCGWCGAAVAVPARGRVPKWCSPTCRHRAWEQSRAVASGRAAVTVVDHVIERAATQPTRSVPTSLPMPKRVTDWVELLDELTDRLDARRIYDRDLMTLRPAVEELVAAYNRRSGPRR